MLDEAKLRKRVLLRLLGSPIVVAPFMLGMTVFTALWATGWRLGLGLFAALAGVLTSAGAFVTRLLLNGEKTARTVIAEMEREGQEKRFAALDELDRRLVDADDDPRPETALRDLRALLKAFEELEAETDAAHLALVLEVRAKVQQLFDQSVQMLEQTFKLGETAKQLRMAAARKPILEQREKIIEDVRAGAKQLGGTLAALQRLGAAGSTDANLARLREELDQSLEVANRVEARLQSLLDTATAEVRGQPLKDQQEKG
ncbi:MAG: hypothetical protein HY735_36685 [Verrucomicrobia bacterium]|nr:hypothetical protein [Verrucomicrobiota bacterium]